MNTITILVLILLLSVVFFIIYYLLYKKDDIAILTLVENKPLVENEPLVSNKIKIIKTRPTNVQFSKNLDVKPDVKQVVKPVVKPVVNFNNRNIGPTITKSNIKPTITDILYKNEKQLKLDPDNSCYIKLRNNNKKYTGYINFKKEERCEYEDDEEFINSFIIYPNVRGYVKNGKITDDISKRNKLTSNWADGDTINYYPELRMDELRKIMTDNDKVIYQFKGFYNDMTN